MLAAASLRAEGVRVTGLAGTVEMRSSDNAAWEPATMGMEIPEGGTVRTSGDGRAELTYPNNGKVWIKESSQITNESQNSLIGRLSMAFGSLKAKFPHLARRQRMEFHTQTAVAAIRGTEITISQTQDGKFDLNVLFGKVDLRLTGLPKSMDVLQGHGYGVGRPGEHGENRLLTKVEEIRGLEKWEPGLSPEKRIAALQDKEQRRDEMQTFVRQVAVTQQQVNQVVNQVKQDDLEAGRTLNDIHGNLVRVDQVLLRPNANELQLINLVQRPDYTSATPGVNAYWTNNGATSIPNRLDAMQTVLDFGAGNNLPSNISAWPTFFSNNSPQKLTVEFSNQTDATDIFALALQGVRCLSATQSGCSQSEVGSLVPNFYVGDVKCAANDTSVCLAGMQDFSNQGTVTNPNGTTAATPCATQLGGCFTQYTKATSGTTSEDHSPSDQLIEISADRYVSTTNPNNSIWLAHDLFVINNSGGVRAITDFTNSTQDPFSVLAQTAVEAIVYVKQNQTVGCSNGASNCVNNSANTSIVPGVFNGGDVQQAVDASGKARNIDLVVTPDVITAVIEKIATDLNNLKLN